MSSCMPRVKTTARIVKAHTNASPVDHQSDIEMGSRDVGSTTVRYPLPIVFQCGNWEGLSEILARLELIV